MAAEIKEKAQPYYLKAEGDVLAILIHGFTGTPYDLKELAVFLHQQGISTKAVLLPGHCSHWKDLEKTTCTDWLEAVDREIDEASKKYSRIFLVGTSFGANLAFEISVKYPEHIKGIISVGISIFLKKERRIRLLLPFYHLFFKKYKKGYIKNGDIHDYEEKGSYTIIPTKSFCEFIHFIDNYTKLYLDKVTAPALIVHSHDDDITHPYSSEYAYDKISSEKKELFYVNNTDHYPLESQVKDKIFTKIYDFILKV